MMLNSDLVDLVAVSALGQAYNNSSPQPGADETSDHHPSWLA